MTASTWEDCRVYWGSHGCDLWRDHIGPCICLECWDRDDTDGYVGSWPYYGPETRFYGEDAAAQWGKDRTLDTPKGPEQ